jgi:hypothetical protein
LPASCHPAFERPKKLLLSDFLNNGPPGGDQEDKDMPVQDLALVGVPVPRPGARLGLLSSSWIEELVGLIREDDSRSEDSVVQVAPREL